MKYDADDTSNNISDIYLEVNRQVFKGRYVKILI